MAAKEIVFSDRLVGIGIHNGLVRLDLATFAGMAKGADDKPAIKLDATQQLVMPLDAFVAAVAMQDQFVKELAAREQQRREARATEAAPAA
ncbi:MAG: hypothetical protein HY021_05405 [Burkholderiales bacterium]|nr:hypothetical protein [Burkholderiales bacterium]